MSQGAKWHLSGPNYPDPVNIQIRYVSAKDYKDEEYCNSMTGKLWTCVDTDRREMMDFSLFQVCRKQDRTVARPKRKASSTATSSRRTSEWIPNAARVTVEHQSKPPPKKRRRQSDASPVIPPGETPSFDNDARSILYLEDFASAELAERIAGKGEPFHGFAQAIREADLSGNFFAELLVQGKEAFEEVLDDAEVKGKLVRRSLYHEFLKEIPRRKPSASGE